jgi:hypothetical protein
MNRFLLICLTFCLLTRSGSGADRLLLEAEAFSDLGGWVVDQQFMDQMGSPYLLAHGLGDPVRDAATTVSLPSAGSYRVWVRTRDWVAPWNAPGAPGRFQVIINGEALPATFGIEGAPWHWQDGGIVKIGREIKVALHDLTGFEGRCDAILFCKDPAYKPPDELAALKVLRRELLGVPDQPENGGRYDLVVVGGGIAGSCAAISAARSGLKVALIQDRPVLGGNGSSEVRVWPEGKVNQQPFSRIGDVVSELVPERGPTDGNAKNAEIYADERKLALVRAEPNITLLLQHRVNQVECKKRVLRAVVAQDTRTARQVRFEGRLFADCTGDGAVGFLAGADHEMSREGHMGASNLWNVKDAGAPEPFPKCLCKDTNSIDTVFVESKDAVAFPRCPWAVDLSNKPFPGRPKLKGPPASDPHKDLGQWLWESGFDRDPITDVEWMRDLNLRAMYGAWDALKNIEKLYPNHKLSWAAYVAGKRESRRLLGDVVLTVDDFRTNSAFADGFFPCSWGIDLHSPHPAFKQGHKGAEFIATYTHGEGYSYKSPYWAPYRCLYSRNINNLFMAGRDISVTHEALGPVRVMRTCGTMGEVVGMAAALCKKFDCTPRAVYEKHLEALKESVKQGAGKVATVP